MKATSMFERLFGLMLAVWVLVSPAMAIAPANGPVGSTPFQATGTVTPRSSADRATDVINVKDGYGGVAGAKGDGRIITPTISISASSTNLTSASSSFVAADIGKVIIIAGAGLAPSTGPVFSQAVTTPGGGYTSVPNCAVSGPGTGATCATLMTLQSATLVTGGSGCTASGTFTFLAAIDAAGTIAQISGTTNGSGVVTGSLTVQVAGLASALGTVSGASIYGANCSTAPTVNLSFGVGAVSLTGQGNGYTQAGTSISLSGGSPATAATLGAISVPTPIPPLVTTILSFVSPTQITLSAVASTTVSATAANVLIATDDSAAFNGAIGAGSGIYIPSGVYYVGAKITLPYASNLTISGSGMNNTILVHDTGTAGSPVSLFEDVAFPVPAFNGSVEMQDFQIRGLLDFGRVNQGSPMVVLNDQLEIREDRMKFYQIPNMAQANELANRFVVMDSVFDTVMRDAARCRSCFNAIIKGNTFIHSDDDSVALHQYAGLNVPGEVREGIVVDGNTFEDTTGIHILGARSASVTNNICRRTKVACVSIQADALEGIDQIRSIVVSGNIATDTLPRVPFSSVPNVFNVTVNPPSAPAGATNFIPGAMFKGTGYVGRPWDFDLSNTTNGSQFVGVARGVSITDNKVSRTLPATTNYSSWGYGLILTNSGFYDVPVTDAALQPTTGITTSTNISSVKITSNDVQDVARCIVTSDAVAVPELSSLDVNHNTCFDTPLGGLLVYGSGTSRVFNVIGNDIDVDPYQISPGRLNNTGAWQNSYGSSQCFQTSMNVVVVMSDNVFSNCYAVQQSAVWQIHRNIVRGSPYSGNTGQPNIWSSANQGLGVFPTFAGDMFFLSSIVANPSLGNTPNQWGALTNTHVMYSASAPTSGAHTIGDIIYSTNPSGCSCVGWQALTTGASWTASTDYKVMPLN